MKILFISLDRNLLDNNSEVVKRHLFYLDYLERQTIIVYSPAKYHLKDKLWHEKLLVKVSGGRNILGSFLNIYKIGKEILKKERYDVIVTQDPFLTGLIGYLLKKKFYLGLNIQLHGDFFSNWYWLKERFFNIFLYFMAVFLLIHANSIRTVSQRIASSLNKFKINQNKVTVVPVYVDWEKLASSPFIFDLKKEYPNKFIILSVGRLVSEKNLPMLIRSFKNVNSRIDNTILLIVGDGPERNRLNKLVIKLNLSDKVFFAGWQEDLVSYYKTADLFVVSSCSEGYNRTVIEAMACGLPVVMTNVGLANEVIKNEINGLIVKTNNEIELTNAMIKLVNDNNLRRQLLEQGLKTIQSLPSAEENFKLQFISRQKAKV